MSSLEPLHAQLIYFCDQSGSLKTVDLSSGVCVVNDLGGMYYSTGGVFVPDDITFHPNGKFYGTDGYSLYEIDINTLEATFIGDHNLAVWDIINSLVCASDGTLYASSNNLYTIDVFNGNAIDLGVLPYQTAGDLAFHNGKLYGACVDNVMLQINIENPQSSIAVGTINSNE